MKLLMNKCRNTYGYISVEIVIVVAIILIGGLIGISKYSSKGKETASKTNDTVAKVYKDYGNVDLTQSNSSQNSSSNNTPQKVNYLITGSDFRNTIQNKDKIKTVSFEYKDANDCNGISYDVSKNKDHSIIACNENNKLVIQSNDKIYGNSDSNLLFNGFVSMEEITFNNFDTSYVKWMDSMFNGCEKLKEIDLSSFKTAEVKTIGGMFAHCGSLKKLDMSNFTAPNLGEIHRVVESSANLEELNISGLQTMPPRTEYAFAGCPKLKKIYVSKKYWDANKVPNDYYIFV